MKQNRFFSRLLLMAGAMVCTLGMATSCGGGDDEALPEPTPEPKFENKTFTAGGVTFTMVAVKGGTFQMGAPDSDMNAYDDEKPQHAVTLSDYYIGETEVTQALWKAVMGSNPSKLKGNKLPVEQVSWDDCQAFITKLNVMTGQTFRLPTEAEWEYAARGGNKSQGCKYSGSNDIDLVAWYTDNIGLNNNEVGAKTANELGIYDMTGNVHEWCQDWFDDYSSEAKSNPAGPETGSFRVIRGGSCFVSAGFSRVLYRNYYLPSRRIIDFGLRLAQ
jgi:formylglycine-generating enzyme required for sulfatase activity